MWESVEVVGNSVYVWEEVGLWGRYEKVCWGVRGDVCWGCGVV